jgi:HEAT repeat protein
MTALALFLVLSQAVNHSEEDCKAVLAKFHADVKGGGEGDKITAIGDLSKHYCDKTVDLLRQLMIDDTEKVRIAAAKAIGKADSQKAVQAVAEAIPLNDKDPAVLEALAQALKDLDREAGAEALNPYLRNHEKYVVEALHIVIPVLGSIGSSSSVDPLLELLKHAETSSGGGGRVKGVKTSTRPGTNNAQSVASLKGVIEKALTEITGHPAEKTSQLWEEWWRGNRASLLGQATVVYRCPSTGKRWEEKVGQPVKCPFQDGPEKDLILIKVKLH